MSKRLYIYENIGPITTNWHSDGGLLIITAADPSEAWRANLQRIAAEHPSNQVYLDPARIIQDLPEPDRVIEVADTEADVVMEFPDAGCC